MSVSLCAVRLEVGNGHKLIDFDNYFARNPLMASGGSCAGPAAAGGSVDADAGRSSQRRHDRRAMGPISVETYVPAEPSDQQQPDVLIGPSGKAVSYAELVRSGREPSLPPPRPVEEPVAHTSSSSPPPSVATVPAVMASVPAGIELKQFMSGNPFVESTEGLLHLYKEDTMTSLDEEVPRSMMVCMMSVPAKLAVHDLLRFTAACYPDIERMRIIRDSTPNQYMVLIKFKAQEAADSFYSNFNGVQYNSLEPELCRLVYVSRVDVVNESEDARCPIPGFTELPTCPVCLERMDESVDGVLTVLCNHSFHGSCLSQWGDTSCPVCRYVQTPEMVEDNLCFECQAQDSLWICLICGHVGCGRYLGGHAYSHFLDSAHTYSMQVGSTRVWDYVGDNFVHRLVQNKEDGKMVEVPGLGNGRSDSKYGSQDEKLEGVQLEYTYLLTSQLQSQRQYYEQSLQRAELQAGRDSEELQERTRAAQQQCTALRDQLTAAQRDKTAADKKAQQLSQRLSRCLKELQEERHMNQSLRENQLVWQSQVSSLQQQLDTFKRESEKEVGELKDQVRDLMFFLGTQEKIASSSSEVQQELAGGSIVVPEKPAAAEEPHRPANGARRKRR